MQKLIEICKKNNLKLTPQRIAIYKAIYKEKSHPSAKYIYQKVKKDFPSISFDTVNRSLNDFSKIGLIQIIEKNSPIRRFDPTSINHPHFHCNKCDSIFDLDFKIKNNYLNIKNENIYKITDKKILFTGLCQNCK